VESGSEDLGYNTTMPIFTTYSELIQTVKDVSEDDSAEVASYIPTAIGIAEEMCIKDLDMKTNIVTTSTAALRNVSIPGGGIETIVSTCILDRGFLYFTDVFQCGQKLDHVEYSATKEMNQYQASIGVSAYFYAFKDDPGQVYVSPAVSGVTFEFNYVKRPDNLSNINTSNDLLEKAPELLYYATMMEMSFFFKNWETYQFWFESYKRSLESHLNVSRRERTDKGQKHMGNAETQSTTGIP
jgi:hypothetical protein